MKNYVHPNGKTGHPRQEKILSDLKTIISSVYGIEITEIDSDSTFVEMGLDSISIMQVKQLVKNEFNVVITVDRLFDDVSTLNALASYIDEKSAPSIQESKEIKIGEEVAELLNLKELTNDVSLKKESVHVVGSPEVNKIMQDQLSIMSKQLEVMYNLYGGK